jgi:hypothetical protein
MKTAKKDVVLRVRIESSTLERLEHFAKTEQVKPSALARSLIEQGLEDFDAHLKRVDRAARNPRPKPKPRRMLYLGDSPLHLEGVKE